MWIIVGVSIAAVLVLIPVVWLVLGSSSEPEGIPKIQFAKAAQAAPNVDQGKKKKVGIPGPGNNGGPGFDEKVKQKPNLIKPAAIDLSNGISTSQIEKLLKRLGYDISKRASVLRFPPIINGRFSVEEIGRDCTKPGAAQPLRYEISHHRNRDGSSRSYFTLSTKHTADGKNQLRAVTNAINPTCADAFDETIKGFELKNNRASRTLGKLTVNVDSKKIELYCYLPGGAPAGPPIAKKNPNNNGVNPQPPIPGAKTPSDLIVGEWVSTEAIKNPNGGKDLTAGFVFLKNGNLRILMGGNEIPQLTAKYKFTAAKTIAFTFAVNGAPQPGKQFTATILSISDGELVMRSEEDQKTTRFVRPGFAAKNPKKTGGNNNKADAGPSKALPKLLADVSKQTEKRRGALIELPKALRILSDEQGVKAFGVDSVGIETYSTHLNEKKLIARYGAPDETGNETVQKQNDFGGTSPVTSKMIRYGWLRILVNRQGEIWYVQRKLD